jgi:hypothetical protein
MIPTRSATHYSISLWAFLVFVHGVAFTMIDQTMHFTLNLVEVTVTLHIITVILLHIVHLIMEVLLFLPPLLHLLRDQVRNIVEAVVQGPL